MTTVDLFQSVKKGDDLRTELYQEEIEALEAMKKREISSHFSERFIMRALFTRKLDLNRTEKLLQNNWNWRKKYGFEELPRMDELDVPPSFWMSGYTIPGARDKEGRMIVYLWPGRIEPKEIPIENMCAWLAWFYGDIFDYLVPMDAHRNGIVFVENFTDFGWKNFDTRFQKALTELIQDCWPISYKMLCIVNPPYIFKPLLAICKLFTKKKLLDRICIKEVEEMKELINVEVLPKEYGGCIDYSSEKMKEKLTSIEREHFGHLPIPNRSKQNTEKMKKKKEKKKKKEMKKEKKEEEETARCPICSIKFPVRSIEEHLQHCEKQNTPMDEID